MTTLTVNASDLAGDGIPDRLELLVTGPSVRDRDGNALRLGGTRKFPTNTGKLAVELLATDTPDTDPLPNTWGYTFELRWDGGGLPAFDAPLPTDPPTVDLSALQPMDPANPVYRGPQGDPGPKGDTGDPGPRGDVGPAGMQWRGGWDVATDYVQDDAVAYLGSTYFAASDPAIGDVPDVATTWQPFALRGAQGDTGAKGDTGEQGPIGLTGEQGPIGLTGPAGPNGAGNLNGAGSPEGVVTATVGTIYADTAKTNGAAIWRKDTGAGNTGWKVIDGDTGDRDISSLLTAQWVPASTAPRFSIRRIGKIATLSARISPTGTLLGVARTSPAQVANMATLGPGLYPGGASTFLNLGVGFLGTNASTPLNVNNQVSATRIDLGGSGGGIWTATDAVIFQASWAVSDTWPVVLP